MNRQELIAAIVEKTGVTKAAGDKVQLVGFGTFERVNYPCLKAEACENTP